MRSPLGVALLFVLLLAGWFASRPIQDLITGGPAPAAEAPPAAATPARMTIQAPLVDPRWKVEITGVALSPAA